LSESEEVEEELDASERVEDAEECEAGRSGAEWAPGDAAPPAAAAALTMSRSGRRRPPVGMQEDAMDRKESKKNRDFSFPGGLQKIAI
jgi:hypothetical protein